MTTITFRVDELVKKNANEVFERLGMNMSEALVLFFIKPSYKTNTLVL